MDDNEFVVEQRAEGRGQRAWGGGTLPVVTDPGSVKKVER
jgi:hypothetical protein